MSNIFFVISSILLLSCNSSFEFPWIKPAQLNRGLPPSAEIFTLNTTSSIFGTNLTGALIRFHFTDKNLKFKIAHSENEKSHTPMDWAKRQQHLVYAVLNGGFFNMALNESASFICSGGKNLHQNIVNKAPRQHIFPTVGAIGALKDSGDFDIQYIYSFDKTFDTYVYGKPNKYPGPQPLRTDGKHWKLSEGIGAGPIVLKNHQLIPGNPEHFDDNIMIHRHPRSAICYDDYGRLTLMAIDGRYAGSAGLTIAQLAQMMKDWGCKDALNLDGGGSTLLYANNHILTKYSDAVPRPVVSAIVVINKNQKKQSADDLVIQ